MNRTDRLYAIVEELRASHPTPRTARELADTYEVSSRTIERDILALQESGVPIWGVTGRRGGYSIDPDRTLPPVNFTPAEALAIAVAVEGDNGPFAAAGRAARNKILAVMSTEDRESTKAMAERVRRFHRRSNGSTAPQVPVTLQRAITERLVVTIAYRDRQRETSTREIEPVGVVSLDDIWYLVGWCRLRQDVRTFRLDRIVDARLTGEVAPNREPEPFLQYVPAFVPSDEFQA